MRRARLGFPLALGLALVLGALQAPPLRPARADGPFAAPWAIPTDGVVNQTYQPFDPDRPHDGIDILTRDAPAPGAAIWAPYPGTVVRVEDACGQDASEGAGNPNPASRVIIYHPDYGVWSVYSHLAEWQPGLTGCRAARSFVLVAPGQSVDLTTQLGWQGNCCETDNAPHITHLHFGVNAVPSPHASGDRVDPTPFITGFIWPPDSRRPVPAGTELRRDAEPKLPEARRVKNAVLAVRPWTDTGLDLAPGSFLLVRGEGEATISPFEAPQPPGGDLSCQTSDRYAVPSLPCWALIGRLGDGAPFLVGSFTTITSAAGGRLYLGLNDEDYGDNDGAWEATIITAAPTPATSPGG